MKRSNQLMVESAVIASVLIMLTLGGSVATTTIPPSFLPLQNPSQVKVDHSSSALAGYYNTTLTQLGARNFENVSFFLETFHFVNIAPAVNSTAQAANSDLASVNVTAANATAIFVEAGQAISAKDYINATILVDQGCALAQQANASLADFRTTQTSRFASESIPVAQYAKGLSAASAMVGSLVSECNLLKQRVTFTGLVLLIGSPQAAIETGGTVQLVGNLTFRGTPVPGDQVLFYINGTYFGSLTTNANGLLVGTLTIPYVYARSAQVQALSVADPALNLGGGTSNVVTFVILFDQTSIVIGDPPAILPTFSFNVSGNLTTAAGAPLPYAPVNVTFFGSSQILRTDARGVFATRLTVPANATDGIHYVYASFAPQGAFGPSVNFTSIEVVHLPMTLTVNTPSLSLAGVSTTVTGTARANGTAIADANVTVSSPWGAVTATTNYAGVYKANIPVSPLEFAFTKNVTVSAVAPQPYVAEGVAVKTLGLFNVILVLLPAAGVAVVGYEALKLGAFERFRKREEAEPMEESLPEAAVEFAESSAGHELLVVYLSALQLASKRFSVRFRKSQTIREALAAVRAKEDGPGAAAFAEIAASLEDFLYAPSFDQKRAASAKAKLAELEGHWR